jgi:hypothetical protein
MSASSQLSLAKLPVSDSRLGSLGRPPAVLWPMAGCSLNCCCTCALLAVHRPLALTGWSPTWPSMVGLCCTRSMDCSLGNIFDVVVHFTVQISPDAVLPSFIDLQDAGSHLAGQLFIFTGQHRHCYLGVGTLAMSASSATPLSGQCGAPPPPHPLGHPCAPCFPFGPASCWFSPYTASRRHVAPCCSSFPPSAHISHVWRLLCPRFPHRREKPHLLWGG